MGKIESDEGAADDSEETWDGDGSGYVGEWMVKESGA